MNLNVNEFTELALTISGGRLFHKVMQWGKKEYLYKLVQAYVDIVDVCGPIKGWVQTEPQGTCNSPLVQGLTEKGETYFRGWVHSPAWDDHHSTLSSIESH